MPPKLSIAMIVKNEAQHLPAFLAEARERVDEVCVVDTGSVDDTVAIAVEAGAALGHFAWCNDFAAARNAALALCTGDWVLVLDADERIAQEDWPRLRALAAGPRDRCYRLITRNYTNDTRQSEFTPCTPDDTRAQGFAGWFPSGKVRLFPNGLGAHFEGKVHELVNPSLERAGLRVLTSDIPVHHYALTKSAEHLRAKQALYLALGLEKLRDAPEDPKAHAELGNQYAEMGDYTRAAQCYRAALQHDPTNAENLKDLGGMMHLLGRNAEAEKALRLAVRLDPALLEGWRNLGVVLAAQEQWAEAATSFAQGLALAPGHAELQRYHAIAQERLGS